jgi:hypothetical protein
VLKRIPEMPDFLRQLIRVFLSVVLLPFVTARPAFAADDDRCVQPPINAIVTRYQSSDGHSDIRQVEILGARRLDICVKIGRCAWHNVISSPEEIRTLHIAFERNFGCERSVWRGEYYSTDCKLSQTISHALETLNQSIGPVIGPQTACGTGGSPLTGHSGVVLRGGVPVFMGSVPVGDLCAGIGVEIGGQLRSFLFLVRACPKGTSHAAKIASVWLDPPASISYFSIGASSDGNVFGVASGGPTFDLKSAKPFVRGKTIASSYVLAWLVAAQNAALRSADQRLPLGEGPVLPADGSAVGRFADWLAAGLMRICAKPFDEKDPNWKSSQIARDWMTRTFLKSPVEYAGTLLRAEKARTDW